MGDDTFERRYADDNGQKSIPLFILNRRLDIASSEKYRELGGCFPQHDQLLALFIGEPLAVTVVCPPDRCRYDLFRDGGYTSLDARDHVIDNARKRGIVGIGDRPTDSRKLFRGRSWRWRRQGITHLKVKRESAAGVCLRARTPLGGKLTCKRFITLADDVGAHRSMSGGLCCNKIPHRKVERRVTNVSIGPAKKSVQLRWHRLCHAL